LATIEKLNLAPQKLTCICNTLCYSTK